MNSNSSGFRKKMMLFDFQDKMDCEAWYSVDDVVMGGVSNSQIEFSEKRMGVFSGTVSLENNGGFASVRSGRVNADLTDFSGILLRVKGDGKAYSLSLKTASDPSEVYYQAKFTAPFDYWSEVSLPFSEFRPKIRGRYMNELYTLRPGDIREIGLMISDKQDGEFRLEIDWIATYKEKA